MLCQRLWRKVSSVCSVAILGDGMGEMPRKCRSHSACRLWRGIDLVTLLEDHNRKFISLEQGVELLGQVDCMPWIAKTYFFILWARVCNQYILVLEVDWLAVVENRPDALRAQYLFAFVVALVHVL